MDTPITIGHLAWGGLIFLGSAVVLGILEWMFHNPNGPGVE
jgi:hypothetical protein